MSYKYNLIVRVLYAIIVHSLFTANERISVALSTKSYVMIEPFFLIYDFMIIPS